MYVVETSSSIFPSSGGTTIFRILDGEGGSPVTNFWYTLSTGGRPSWETHTKSAETFTVTFDENTEQEERSITYTFYREVDVDGVLTEESASVIVTQTGYTIPSSVNDVEVTEEQQTTEVTIENVSNASILIDSPWLSALTPSRNVLQLFIQENEESTERTAIVTLNFSSGSLSFNVIQAASSTSDTGTVIYDDEGNSTEFVQIVETLEHEITNTGAVVDVTPNANAVLPLSFYGSNVPWIYDVQQPDETVRIVIRRNPDGETLRKGTFRVTDAAGKINIITVNQEAGATLSGENYRFLSKRYVMRQEAVSVPVTQTRTILQNLAVERETANFSLSSIARSDFLAPHGDDEGLDEWKIDGYDAYSLCCRHVTNETTGIVTHTLLAGAVLYRFDLPWAVGTPAVNSLRLSIKSDAYTPKGAKITLVKINRGATQFVRSDMIALSTENRVARRRVSGENWVSTVEDIQIQSFSFVPTETTTLGVLVELEDYAHIRDSWVEGSSGLNLPVVFNFADVIPGMESFGNGEVAVNPTTGAAIPATSATFSPTMILTNGRVHLTNHEAAFREFCYLSSSVIALPSAANLEISPPGTTFFASNTLSSFNFDVTSLPTGETQFGVSVSDTNWMSVSTTATSFEVLLSAQLIGATARTGTVTITSGAQSKVLTFNQAAGEEETHLRLSSASASIAATDTTGPAVFVTSFPNGVGTNYTASSDVEWLSFTTSGIAISWTAKKNGYGSSRVGHIQIASGGETVNFTVTQAANSTPMLSIPTNHILEPAGGSTTFDLQYPEGTTINGVSLTTGGTWAQATLLSGNAQVSTQSALNYGSARVGIVTVTATYDGVDYEIKYAIRQKGLAETAFTNKLIKLSPAGVASNLVSPVATSNIDHISVCGDTCFLSGSFTNLFGQTGKNEYVPVGITANATKAITQLDGAPSSFPFAPEVMLRGYLSCPLETGDPRGNPLYGVREFANDATNFLYDVNATTIGFGIAQEVWWSDNGDSGVHGVSKMVSPPIDNMSDSHKYFWSLFNGSKIVKRCQPRAKSGAGNWYQYPALPSQPYALALALDGSKVYVAGGFGLRSNSTSSTGGAWTTVTQSSTLPPSSKMTPKNNEGNPDWTNFNMVFDRMDGKLVVSGSFTNIDNSGVSYLAKWDGGKWVPYSWNHVVTAPVKDMDAYSGGLILTGDFTSYKTPGNAPEMPALAPPPSSPEPEPEITLTYPDPTHPSATVGTTVLSIDSLYGTLAISQVMAGLREHYAKAFNKQIIHRTLGAGEVTQVYQSGLNCVLRISEESSNLICATSLSALLLRMETPTSFVPKMLSITAPESSSINIPEGADLRITFWWKAGSFVNFDDMTTAFKSGSFWNGSGTDAAGFKNICRIQITPEDADTVIFQKIEGNVFTGGFGTMLVVPWLRIDRISTVPIDGSILYGVGSLNVTATAVENEELGWNPIVRLHG